MRVAYFARPWRTSPVGVGRVNPGPWSSSSCHGCWTWWTEMEQLLALLLDSHEDVPGWGDAR
jgi:hypothetical protein